MKIAGRIKALEAASPAAPAEIPKDPREYLRGMADCRYPVPPDLPDQLRAALQEMLAVRFERVRARAAKARECFEARPDGPERDRVMAGLEAIEARIAAVMARQAEAMTDEQLQTRIAEMEATP